MITFNFFLSALEEHVPIETLTTSYLYISNMDISNILFSINAYLDVILRLLKSLLSYLKSH